MPQAVEDSPTLRCCRALHPVWTTRARFATPSPSEPRLEMPASLQRPLPGLFVEGGEGAQLAEMHDMSEAGAVAFTDDAPSTV